MSGGSRGGWTGVEWSECECEAELELKREDLDF